MNKPVPRLSRHYIATLVSKSPELLMDMPGCMAAIEKILAERNVECVGQVSHEFHNKSFTSVYALSESHISIHTWPERHVVQLDVFLCNYIHDNTSKGKSIFDAIIDYFKPYDVTSTIVERL